MPDILKNRKFLIGTGVVVILLIVVIAYFLLTPKTKTAKYTPAANSTSSSQASASNNQSDPFMMQYGQNCENKDSVTFSASPLALDKMSYLEPLGKMSDGHVTPIDHVYLAPLNSGAADNTYDVVMPADGKVVQIDRMPAEYIGDMKNVKLAQDDFRLVLSFSCRYFSIFIHVHKLSDTLAKEGDAIAAGQNKQVNISLKAGDLLAHLGGNPFDWTMVDMQTTLKGFITPKLYESEPWKIHTISPFDVYTGGLKSSLEAKSLRTVAPIGGKLDWDRSGALIGNWFRQGTNGYQGSDQSRYWDGHLAIAPNHIDPTGIVYSTGNWGGAAKQLLVKGDFKPEEVTAATGMVKIELVGINYLLASGAPFSGGAYSLGMKIDKSQTGVVGTVLLQVQAGEKLKVEQFPGKTASQVSAFTSNAQTYER